MLSAFLSWSVQSKSTNINGFGKLQHFRACLKASERLHFVLLVFLYINHTQVFYLFKFAVFPIPTLLKKVLPALWCFVPPPPWAGAPSLLGTPFLTCLHPPPSRGFPLKALPQLKTGIPPHTCSDSSPSSRPGMLRRRLKWSHPQGRPALLPQHRLPGEDVLSNFSQSTAWEGSPAPKKGVNIWQPAQRGSLRTGASLAPQGTIPAWGVRSGGRAPPGLSWELVPGPAGMALAGMPLPGPHMAFSQRAAGSPGGNSRFQVLGSGSPRRSGLSHLPVRGSARRCWGWHKAAPASGPFSSGSRFTISSLVPCSGSGALCRWCQLSVWRGDFGQVCSSLSSIPQGLLLLLSGWSFPNDSGKSSTEEMS